MTTQTTLNTLLQLTLCSFENKREFHAWCVAVAYPAFYKRADDRAALVRAKRLKNNPFSNTKSPYRGHAGGACMTYKQLDRHAAAGINVVEAATGREMRYSPVSNRWLPV